MNNSEFMTAIDAQVAHIWMVRTFLKHSDEAAEDEELAEVHRELYDFAHSLGEPLSLGDSAKYLRMVEKKLSKLRRSAELFAEIQPEISGHMNYRMARVSLTTAVNEITRLHTAAKSLRDVAES
jgi:hypothetical protein